jgi:hypothetical protein
MDRKGETHFMAICCDSVIVSRLTTVNLPKQTTPSPGEMISGSCNATAAVNCHHTGDINLRTHSSALMRLMIAATWPFATASGLMKANLQPDQENGTSRETELSRGDHAAS